MTTDPTICVHCGDRTTFADDPSPDLCHMCRVAGRLSPEWDLAREEGYQRMQRRLDEAGMAFRSGPARDGYRNEEDS